MLLPFRKPPKAAISEELELLGRHAGVGLWDAVLHDGDPMHEKSAWRWSGEFRRLLGFARDDVRGFPDVVASWADRLHSDDAQPTFAAFAACLGDRSGRTGYDVTYRLKMKDGGYRWFRAIGGVARDAQGVAVRACGSLIDIDAEKAELERAAVLDAHAGVGLWDAIFHEGDPMHEKSAWRWSGEFRRLIGFARDDVRGFPDVVASWADRLHPDDAQPTFAAFAACLGDRSGRTGYDVTYRLKMKDGGYRWFHAIGGVVRDAQGVALRACGSLIDVEAHKSAEFARGKAEAARRELVADLAGNLDSNVVTAADRATASAQSVAAATEQLSASITDISSRAARAAQSSSNAAEVVRDTESAVSALMNSAERIGAVTSLISDIASQTNLLALNATIEAARAGDMGKGFAVVAGEVKTLANQTANATDEIAGQISAVQQGARRAGEAIRKIGTIIEDVRELSTTIAEAVAQQDDATREIASNVSRVVDDIETVSRNVASVSEKLRE
ncbi:putative methyl-accepting chemotaxis sensory transducer [uncultured Alphaproteobacteria bacterium]|uniref:Putative methyl-accepting chemotaxis sensory transducer n=1 Tax=uncultured Alphaproteobacteria bacterium TaxID=91750 RepID=A0A212JUP5_9PROT|nr:putative methyl-accepting chemotaxis sensory transducer [uncultured Alphaproteobacteria bacterium]